MPACRPTVLQIELSEMPGLYPVGIAFRAMFFYQMVNGDVFV